MTDHPAHGCTIDGQPAMPVLVADHNQLVARAEEAEKRLRLAHQARRAKEHQLDDIRRALCDVGLMQDDDPYSHADLADVIRQSAAALDQPGPAATQATDTPPSQHPGLHGQIVNALGQIPVVPPAPHRRAQADQVLALLYREWPWLRAAAEDGSWLNAGTCGLSIPAPEPSDPTQCTGEEGFCPEHGFHRHSLKQPGPA